MNKAYQDVKKYDHVNLLNALFWVFDGFDRAMMGLFFVYSTAESIIQNKDLEGDGVHAGVRRLEWGNIDSRSGSRPIFEAFAGEAISKSENLWTYDYYGVPVFIHIFDEDPCILNTQTVMYRNEMLKIPNPYKTFLETYSL